MAKIKGAYMKVKEGSQGMTPEVFGEISGCKPLLMMKGEMLLLLVNKFSAPRIILYLRHGMVICEKQRKLCPNESVDTMVIPYPSPCAFYVGVLNLP